MPGKQTKKSALQRTLAKGTKKFTNVSDMFKGKR